MHQNKSRDRDLPGREVHPKDNPKLIYSMYNLKLNINDVLPWVDAIKRSNQKYVYETEYGRKTISSVQFGAQNPSLGTTTKITTTASHYYEGAQTVVITGTTVVNGVSANIDGNYTIQAAEFPAESPNFVSFTINLDTSAAGWGSATCTVGTVERTPVVGGTYDYVVDSLHEGQIASKVWLIEQLNEVIIKVNLDNTKKKTKKIPVNPNVLVCGGWCGVMATLLFNSNIKVNNVRSIDIDPRLKPIALTMNKHYKLNGKFTAGTCNMLDFKNYNDYDMIINTVCEHIAWDDYYKWLDKIPKDRLIILQSCNYIYPPHISCVSSEEDFKKKCGVTNILYSGTLEQPKYIGKFSDFKRYMVIGNKNG